MPLSPSPASTTARDDVTSASVPADETGLAQTRQPPPFLTPPMQAYPASAGGAASSGAGAASYVASAAPPMQHAYYRTSADAAYAAAAAAAAAARNDHMHYPASLPSGPAFLNNSMLLGDISALTPPPPSIDCTRSGAGGVWSPYPTANTCAGLPQQAAPVSLLAPATQTQPPNPAAAGNPGAVGAAAPASAAAVPPPSMMAAPAAVAAPTGPTRSGSTPASSPQPMRPRSRRRRRKYNEIERIYVCGYEGCTKAYGTLNHLNAHVLDHNHGPRRTPEEFSEIRAAWRERKRRQEREAMAQLALQQEQEASRAAAQLTPVFLEAPTYYDMLRHPSLRQPPPAPSLLLPTCLCPHTPPPS
ncbi:hypothetical protein SJAG_01553 [Schizosaccharomyces japonicus yFS275]|uniref:C2H2-type domain-containing protein n=1 Tax=Schizosaccharomyces japonicus (strain yFS275 / FY16936) TaxID=402676 RepID=B6JY93_SCHJY|nr:hypothetical protein SJAG_01553 [Schizosaccharomyces japonicus yFS275]EEB06511.1 hypothetical protein SJAG_01553 [Schizosaccharomyces japonicus yFS275]